MEKLIKSIFILYFFIIYILLELSLEISNSFFRMIFLILNDLLKEEE